MMCCKLFPLLEFIVKICSICHLLLVAFGGVKRSEFHVQHEVIQCAKRVPCTMRPDVPNMGWVEGIRKVWARCDGGRNKHFCERLLGHRLSWSKRNGCSNYFIWTQRQAYLCWHLCFSVLLLEPLSSVVVEFTYQSQCYLTFVGGSNPCGGIGWAQGWGSC